MNYFKHFCSPMGIFILIVVSFAKSECSFVCGHRKSQHQPTTISKYDFMSKTIITLNPETEMEIVKFAPKKHNNDMSKVFYVLKNHPFSKDKNKTQAIAKSLVAIVKALQQNEVKNRDITKSTSSKDAYPSFSKTTPPQTNSVNVHNGVISGHSYVYNIQNYGTHYHNYGLNSPENSKPHIVDYIPTKGEKANENQNHNKNVWINDVKNV